MILKKKNNLCNKRCDQINFNTPNYAFTQNSVFLKPQTH